jgi:DNA-directed RNA polymerase specialized sigma24 family protein
MQKVKNENTFYSWLDRARKKLKETLGGEPLGQ